MLGCNVGLGIGLSIGLCVRLGVGSCILGCSGFSGVGFVVG